MLIISIVKLQQNKLYLLSIYIFGTIPVREHMGADFQTDKMELYTET